MAEFPAPPWRSKSGGAPSAPQTTMNVSPCLVGMRIWWCATGQCLNVLGPGALLRRFCKCDSCSCSFRKTHLSVVCDRFHLFDENYLGRGITVREREVNRVIADVPRPTRDEFTKASPVVGKQGANCFLKPRQVARDGGHEAIGRVLRCADAIPIATSAPRLVN